MIQKRYHFIKAEVICPYYTIPSQVLGALKKKPFENIVGKEEIAGEQHFSFHFSPGIKSDTLVKDLMKARWVFIKN